MNLKEMRDRYHAGIPTEAEAVLAKAKVENRDPSDEEVAKLEALKAEQDSLAGQITAAERRESVVASFTRKPEASKPSVTTPSGIIVGADNAGKKPFASLGEQLVAIAAAGQGGPIDPRLVELNASVTGAGASVGSDGGYLIQPEITVDLAKDAFEAGALASRCSPTNLGPNSDTLKVVMPDETDRSAGVWGGVRVYRTAEGGTATPTRPKLKMWECRVEKLMGIGYATDEILEDATALGQVFREAFLEAFPFQLDEEIYRGTGAAQCLGILSALCTVQVDKEAGQPAKTIVAENVMNMWARVHARSQARGIWVFNNDCLPQLMTLMIGTGASGQLVFMPPGGLSQAPNGSIFGRPAMPIEDASTLGTIGDLAFIDLSQYKLVRKGAIKEDVSMHVRFLNGEQTFRWTARVNGKPKLDKPLTPKNGTSTTSPFVVLKTRS